MRAETTGKSPTAVSAVEDCRKQQLTPPVSLEIDGQPVPVFCVNLARRPERWAAMRRRLAASLTPEDAARVERVDAVDGAALSDAQLRQCLTRRACPSKANLVCFLLSLRQTPAAQTSNA